MRSSCPLLAWAWGPGQARWGLRGGARTRGIAEQPGSPGWWSPGVPGGSGAARGVRSAARPAPCPLRPRAPAAGTWGKRWGSWRAPQPLSPPSGAPRAPARVPSLEAARTISRGCAAASQQPSYSLPARRGCASSRPLPSARRPRRPPPSPPRRPARGPGSPRSPALDNALVKTAELFLTSPPPLLIKAPP